MRNYTAKQKKVKSQIVGADKIVKRLKAMDNKASEILMQAAKKGGKIILEDAQNKCPVDTGTLRDSLKIAENISKPTKADVKLDYDRKIKYGAFVELGAKGRPGNPFMRKAVDDNIERINKAITEDITKAVIRKW